MVGRSSIPTLNRRNQGEQELADEEADEEMNLMGAGEQKSRQIEKE